MSALTDKIAAEHHVYRTYVHDDLACTGCDFAWQRSASDVADGTLDGTAVQEAAAAHIAAVTEAAVREQVAQDIEAARAAAPAWVDERHLSAWTAALASAAWITLRGAV